jgi:hypothetical protein
VKWCLRVHGHWLCFTLPSFSAPSSAAGGLAAALAPADVSALAGAKVAPVATEAVDELVPVRVMSSLSPESLGAMVSQPLECGNSERAGRVGAVRRYASIVLDETETAVGVPHFQFSGAHPVFPSPSALARQAGALSDHFASRTRSRLHVASHL